MCLVAGDEGAPEKSRRTQTSCLQGVGTPFLSPPLWEIGRSLGHTLSDSDFLDQTLLCAPSLSVGVTRPVLTLAHPAPAAFLPCALPRRPSAIGTPGPLPPWSPVACPQPCQDTVQPRRGLRSGTGECPLQTRKQNHLGSSLFPSVFSHFPCTVFQIPSCFYAHRPVLSLLFSSPQSRRPALSSSLPFQGELENVESSPSAAETGQNTFVFTLRVSGSALPVGERRIAGFGDEVSTVPHVCPSERTAQKCASVRERWGGPLLPVVSCGDSVTVHAVKGRR